MGGSSFSELDLSHHGHLGIGDRGHAAAQNSRTPPNCARCRNHDVILPLKGHKRYCKYIDCKCEKCLLTAERQKVMARQTAIRRAEEQDRQREQKGLPVPGKGITPPLRSPAAAAAPCHPDLDHGNSSQRRSPSPDIVVTAAASPAASRRPPSPRRQHSNNAQEELKKTSNMKEEVWRQGAPVDHLNPFMYHPSVLSNPSATLYKQHFNYYPHLTSAHRYHPYPPYPAYTGLVPHKTVFRGLEPFHCFPHEQARASVLMSTERLDHCFNPDDCKPDSPDSLSSEKSNYSGSLDS